MSVQCCIMAIRAVLLLAVVRGLFESWRMVRVGLHP